MPYFSIRLYQIIFVELFDCISGDTVSHLVNIELNCGVNSMKCVTANISGPVMQMLLEIVTGKQKHRLCLKISFMFEYF